MISQKRTRFSFLNFCNSPIFFVYKNNHKDLFYFSSFPLFPWSFASHCQEILTKKKNSEYLKKDECIPCLSLFNLSRKNSHNILVFRNSHIFNYAFSFSMFSSYRSFSSFSTNNSEVPQSPKLPENREIKKIRDNIQFTWRQAFFTTFTCSLILFAWLYQRNQAEKTQRVLVTENVIGRPKLGCDWILFNQDGKIVSNFDFYGKYLLIYFGFTFCPDVCPQELEKQNEVVKQLEEKFGDIVQPIFITVDPCRDTIAQIRAYCEEFHPRLVGLTGTPMQIKKVTQGFRVYYNQGVRSSEEDYLVDHSIIHYLIGPNGKFRDFYGKNLTVKNMVDKISSEIIEDNKKKQKKINVTDDIC